MSGGLVLYVEGMDDEFDDAPIGKLGLTRAGMEACPRLYSAQDYREMANAAVEWWKERAGPANVAKVRKMLKARKEGLYVPSGLSKETQELQFAFIMPQAIENLFAMATNDPDWIRTRPQLTKEIVDAFSIGVMGEYDSSVKGVGGRDFGLAPGSGDID